MPVVLLVVNSFASFGDVVGFKEKVKDAEFYFTKINEVFMYIFYRKHSVRRALRLAI